MKNIIEKAKQKILPCVYHKSQNANSKNFEILSRMDQGKIDVFYPKIHSRIRPYGIQISQGEALRWQDVEAVLE
jgi:hypothetical protein